jgi:sugar phosphate isomerase/epimerase
MTHSSNGIPHNPVGLSTGALFPDYVTEDALDVAAGHGFRVVEMYLQTHGEYTPSFVMDVRQRLDASGLAVHSLHNDLRHYDLWSAYARRAAEAFALFERLLDMAATLGAKAITWHGYGRYVADPASFDHFAAVIHSLGERAQQLGVTITLENVSWCYLRGVEQVRQVCAAGLPVGFTFDSFQAAEAGYDPPDIIRAMRDHLTTVHLSDFGQDQLRHLPLGQGSIDWPPIFATLAEIDYQGPIIVEAPYRGDLNVITTGKTFVEQFLAANNRHQA